MISEPLKNGAAAMSVALSIFLRFPLPRQVGHKISRLLSGEQEKIFQVRYLRMLSPHRPFHHRLSFAQLV